MAEPPDVEIERVGLVHLKFDHEKSEVVSFKSHKTTIDALKQRMDVFDFVQAKRLGDMDWFAQCGFERVPALFDRSVCVLVTVADFAVDSAYRKVHRGTGFQILR
jgi:hypothetical protein